jgi:hypothetical protein
MLNPTSMHKLRRGAAVMIMSVATLLPAIITPTATYADEITKTKFHFRCCRPLDIGWESEKIKTDPVPVPSPSPGSNMAANSNEPSIAGSGTATIFNGQLLIALTKIDVQRSNVVSVSQPTELRKPIARSLGYQTVTVLPGEYPLGPDHVVRINVNTGTPLTETSSAGKFEVGGQFASLNLGHSSRTAPGFGTRLTYNVLPNIALESEVNYFPERGQGTNSLGGGPITQAVFGLKTGKRFETLGVFGKVRPGLISFGETILGRRNENGRLTTISGRTTHSALDVGGVLEFYPSSRIVTRFDFGDTIIRFPCPTPTNPFPTGGVTSINPCPFFPQGANASPPKQYLTKHNFQFNSSVSFRF